MSTLTTNLNLIKPALTDTANITTTNPNWDSLDAAVTGKATTLTATGTITTTWTGASAPFSQVVSITGLLSTDNPIVDIITNMTPATATLEINAWAKIYKAVTANGTITFYATEATTQTLSIQLKVVR